MTRLDSRASMTAEAKGKNIGHPSAAPCCSAQRPLEVKVPGVRAAIWHYSSVRRPSFRQRRMVAQQSCIDLWPTHCAVDSCRWTDAQKTYDFDANIRSCFRRVTIPHLEYAHGERHLKYSADRHQVWALGPAQVSPTKEPDGFESEREHERAERSRRRRSEGTSQSDCRGGPGGHQQSG